MAQHFRVVDLPAWMSRGVRHSHTSSEAIRKERAQPKQHVGFFLNSEENPFKPQDVFFVKHGIRFGLEIDVDGTIKE